MINPLHWLAFNWKSWAVPSIFGFLGGIVAGTFKWFYPSRNEWLAERQAKAEKRLDALVLEALTDPKMARSSKGTTGAGLPINRVGEIAAHLKRDYNKVHDSLVRLHSRDRVRFADERWFRIPD